MTTLIRLLRLIRCLSLSSKTTLTKINALEDIASQRLVHSQALFLTKQKNSYVTGIQGLESKETYSDDQKMVHLAQFEIQKYGRLFKFNVDELLKDIKASGVVTSLQGLFLLQCCSQLMSNKSSLLRRVLADNIWTTLQELDIQLDVSHYNALLNVYAETDHTYSPAEFLEKMVDAGIKPNRVTFQKLISQLCSEGIVSEASQMVNHAKSEGIPVNEEMLSSLAYGHFLNDNDDGAFKILKDMKELGLEPTIKTYSILMYVYASRGDIDNTKKNIKECEVKECYVPDKVLLKIVHNLSLHGFPQYTDEILSLTRRGNMYLREATKIMCKLIEKHHYETAFKIFETLPENKTIIGGNIFLQTLIYSNAPLEKCIEYCKIMEKEKLNSKAFQSAIQKSIANDMYESGMSLMKAWKDLGGIVKEHYFNPILKAYGEAGQYQGISTVLQKMIVEFEMQPSTYFLNNYVIPYMPYDDDKVLYSLLGNEVDQLHASNAVLVHLLSKNKIREAVKFMSNHYESYTASIVRHSLLNAFKNTEDAPMFIWILHYLYMTLRRFDDGIVQNDAKKIAAQNFVDSIILETIDFILSRKELCSISTTNNKYLILVLFRNLIDKGINLSSSAADDIRLKLCNDITPKISEALESLKSENFIPKPIPKELQIMSWKRKLKNTKKLESLVKSLSVKNKKKAILYQKKLIYYYFSTLNDQKMYELLQDFQLNGIEISSSMYACIIDTYSQRQKIEEAELWLMRAKTTIPDFYMSKIILLKLATTIAEDGRFERALECLNQLTRTTSSPLFKTCKKFLSTVMKFDDENYLVQAFDVLNENGYITKMENGLFAPLILLHLQRGHTKLALEKFEWAYKVHGAAPCQVQLMKIFIENGDESSLSRVKTISEKVDGSLTLYFNLALAHIENSQLDIAKDILQTHVPNIPQEFVFRQAEYYYNSGKIDNLEKLFDVLDNLNYDVERLCIVLLKSFGHYNEWEKGCKLWERMQKGNIKPSSSFIDYLYLIVNKKESAYSVFKEFDEGIYENDELKTRELLEKLPLLYKSDGYSKLCKKYIVRKNCSEAMELYKDLRTRFNVDINPISAEFILNYMLRNKDVTNIEEMGMWMSNELKKQINYIFYLNRVYLTSGSWNLYLKNLQERLDSKTLNLWNLNMHVKTTVNSLTYHPELLEQYESIAYKCYEKKINVPIQVLWIYHFLEGDSRADELWSEYVQNSKCNVWLEVRNFIKQKNDSVMFVKLAKLLKDSRLAPSMKLNYFTKLIELCLESDHPDKYEHGVKCLQHGTQEFSMESYNLDLLVDLQIGLENSKLTWPWSQKQNNENQQNVRKVIEAIKELSKSSH